MGLISVETMGNRPENGSNHGRKTDGQKAIRTRLARAAAVLDVALALHDVPELLVGDVLHLQNLFN